MDRARVTLTEGGRLVHQHKPRVLLADDHVIVLDGLRRLLEDAVEVLGTVKDGRTLLDEAARLHPEMVIVDIAMPQLNGLEAGRRLKKKDPLLKVIFLTQHTDPAFAAEAFRAGASGFVLKECAVEELLVAVREVYAGGTYITPRIAGGVLHSMAKSTDSEQFARRLTPRQREVLQLVAEGKSIKEIAAVLGISPKTAEFHKYNIMDELNLHTTAELTKYAVRHGLVEA